MDGGFLTGNDIDSPAQAKGKEVQSIGVISLCSLFYFAIIFLGKYTQGAKCHSSCDSTIERM